MYTMSTTVPYIRMMTWAILGLLLAHRAAHAQSSHAMPPVAQDHEADGVDVDVAGTIQSSLRMLIMQHAIRVGFQDKTRRELGGPFFADYRRSVRVPAQWSDGDSWLANYVGHPIQGAASGFIWLDNHRNTPRQFAANRDYWRSRTTATVFAAAYSLQFEFGPLSEASIGNVGLRRETGGWVDHVVTPMGGLLFMTGEDVLDRFVIAKLEGRVRSPVLKALIRMTLNPSRGAANVVGLRYPWDRSDRPLRP